MQPSAAGSIDGAAILVTGGAGFVGSHVARALAAAGGRVTALDNLRRRGSEFQAARLPAAGVKFVRGDVRSFDELSATAANVDIIVECAAEPSVLAGQGADARYALETNLGGTQNVLELA